MVDDLAVLVVRDVLAEVPDVAGLVLGVPVVGDLDRHAVLGDRVADHAGLDPLAIIFVSSVTSTTTFCLVPLVSVSL